MIGGFTEIYKSPLSKVKFPFPVIIAIEEEKGNKWLGDITGKHYRAPVSVRKLKDLGLFERQRKQDRHLKLKTIKDIDLDETAETHICISIAKKDGEESLVLLEISAKLKLLSCNKKFDFGVYYRNKDGEEGWKMLREMEQLIKGAKKFVMKNE